MEKTLNVILLSSDLINIQPLSDTSRESLNLLRSLYNVNFISEQYIDKVSVLNNFTVVFIESGGSEEKFLQILNKLPKLVVIISDSYHNSLPAALEISSWLYNNKTMFKHLNIPAKPSTKYLNEIKEELTYLETIQCGLNRISSYNIALIGDESPWLISSKVNEEKIQKLYGVKFTEIETQEIVTLFNGEHAADNDSLHLIEQLSEHKEDSNISDYSIHEAVRLYNVLKKICKEQSINALTIKCFDFIDTCHTTACLALALLNDSDIVSGCEGDIPALWSMIIAKEICGSSSFMANPSSIERTDKSVDFAHCTAPFSIGDSFSLTTHYESNIGVGITVNIALGKFTLFKCSGDALDKFYLFKGDVVQNTAVQERCRTQVKFIFKEKEHLDSFLKSHLGNHAVLIPGKHIGILTCYIKLINSGNHEATTNSN
ncbi:MAG: hypothetical protein WCR71_02765 [Bacteroidales bacterium]